MGKGIIGSRQFTILVILFTVGSSILITPVRNIGDFVVTQVLLDTPPLFS